jgi:two-component system nitrate/nitrite response regulator NarL
LETVIIGGTELFREGLRRLLAPKGFEVVFAESRLAEASRSGGPPAPPAIVILSSEPRVALTVDEVRAVRERFPCSALICVCSDFDEEQVVPLLECGVSAILTRTTGVDTLVQAVELALMGHRVVPCLPPSPAETAARAAERGAGGAVRGMSPSGRSAGGAPSHAAGLRRCTSSEAALPQKLHFLRSCTWRPAP